jgi:hypothetical protein
VRRPAQSIKESNMLKAIVSYSKKIPVPDSQFSSQGFSLSLETEVLATDPAAIQAKLHETYELVRATVEQELANGNGNGHAVKPPEAATPPAQRPATIDKASNKQVAYITSLWTSGGGQISDLNARIRQQFGVNGLFELDKRTASQFVDELKREQKKAA